MKGDGEQWGWRFRKRENPNIFRDTLRDVVPTDLLQYRRFLA